MFFTIRGIIRVSTFIAVIVIILLAGLSLEMANLSHQTQKRISHTQTVIAEANELRALMLDAETSERGYRIVNDKKYLTPYDNAISAIPRHLAILKELVADKPTQKSLLGQIEELIKRKTEIMQKAVDLHMKGQPLLEIDEDVLNNFRLNMNVFMEEERKIFNVRVEKLEEQHSLIFLCIFVLVLFSASYAIFAVRQMEKIEKRMRAAEDIARQSYKMEAIGQLTGGIAHDFNNIIQAVITNLDLAARKLPLNQPALSFIQSAIDGLDRGAKLTKQLLAFARKHPLRPEPVQVYRHLVDTVNFLRRTLGDKYQVEFISSGGLWQALIDPNLLQNAILNLALNARDAMPEGGKLLIEASNATLDSDYASRESEVVPGQYVMIAVSDTGKGMAQDIAKKAFDPFFTTKEEGTGLGLAMVFGFIKQSEGHVKIYSEPEYGTTIKMYLPRTTKEVELQSESQYKELRGNGRTILVVEDDDSVRAGAVTQLSDLGYKVVSACDGLSALEIINNDHSIDILFTDVVLVGEMNGKQLASRARQMRSELPVVYTSGYTENSIIHNGRLDDGVVLLSKPYRTADLARVIAGAIAVKTGKKSAELNKAVEFNKADNKQTILVVEDDEMVRSSLIMVLETTGSRVLSASSAKEALDLLNNNKVDLLITDLSISDMNGIDLAQTAKKKNPALEVIIASGTTSLSDEMQTLSDPSIHYLQKPFTAEQLLSVIDKKEYKETMAVA